MIRLKRGPYIPGLSGTLQNSLRVHIVTDGEARGKQAGVIPSVAQGLHAGSDILVVTITEERNKATNGPD